MKGHLVAIAASVLLAGCSSAPPTDVEWLRPLASVKSTSARGPNLQDVEPRYFASLSESVAAFAHEDAVVVRSIADGAVVASLSLGRWNTYGVAASPDGRFVAASIGHDVQLLDCERGSSATLTANVYGHSLAFSPNGQHVLVADEGHGTLEMFDRDAKRLEWAFSYDDAPSRPGSGSDHIESLAFSPDGALVAASSWESHLYLLDAKTGHLVRHISTARLAMWNGQLTRVISSFTALAFTPDGRRLIGGSQGGGLDVFDIESGAQTRAIYTRRSSGVMAVLSVRSAETTYALAALRSGVLSIFDVDSGAEVACVQLPRDTFASRLRLTRDGELLATFGVDGFARYAVDLSKL